MASIKIDLDHPIQNGEAITFAAPCDCTAITGMIVYYPTNEGDTENKTFAFKDSHNNDLTGIGNLFSQGAYVKVLVNTENGVAYIQNADTNGYLEKRLPRSVAVTLAKAGWSSNQQTVTVSGISANEAEQMITPVPAVASQAAYDDACIKAVAQAENSLTFAADSTPSTDLTVYVVIQEVRV